jgi:2-polyprenyl-6-methoxyphenol hydroxylase-like FAD-dependent oxidoreductase
MHVSTAIVGGGMGGLALARTLSNHGIASAVFERESGPGLRSQGGSLDLHPESGQRAMRIAGLEDEFWNAARRGGEELHISDVDRTAPEVSELVGAGSLWGFGSNLSFGAQRNGDGGMRVSLSVRGGENWMAEHGITEDDPSGTRESLHAILKDWSPKLTQMIDATDDYVVPRQMMSMPAGVGWTHHEDVTLLGDAAHLMPPAGEGANQALLDGALPAQSLIANGVDSDGSASPSARAAAIEQYETEMFPRASQAAAQSLEMVRIGLGPDAAEQAAMMFQP